MKFSELSVVLLFVFIPSIHCGTVGGVHEIPVDSPEAIRVGQIAIVKLNEGVQENGKKTLDEIITAKQQIVAGTLTTLIIKVAQKDVKSICEVQIWEQPWVNKIEMTSTNCNISTESDSKRKRQAILDLDENAEQGLFNKFVKKFNKVYSDDEEYIRRFHIFRANLKKIQFLRENEQGNAKYGLTWFSDMSVTEYKNYLGLRVPEIVSEIPKAEVPNVKIPENFDWRHYNVVTPVKNQKSCGSCWAFSAVANIESQWALKKHELVSLSEQELVDCDKKDNGCGGGFMEDAFAAVMKMGGLEPEDEYPYEGRNDVCRFNKSEAVVKISGMVKISKNETEMAQWLFKNGPMSAALNALGMMFYHGGVSHLPNFLCTSDNLNHGILIVGFGIEKTSFSNKRLPYWIIKNSWGKRFGESGYYRLYRGKGTCGINQDVSSSVVN